MKKLKDIKVEILRIICCFLVISYHIRPQSVVNGEIKESVVFVEALCSICVNTFFILSGFFIYENRKTLLKSWYHVFINYIKNIFIPFLIFAFICFVFDDAFFFRKSALECIKDANLYAIIKEIGVGIRYLIVYTWPLSTAHLWYIFAYAFIIIFYPITKLILKNTNKIVPYIVIILMIIVWIAFDIIVYYYKFEDNYYLNLVPKVIAFSMIGSVLYNDFIKTHLLDNDSGNKYVKNYRLMIFSIIAYVVSVISLFIIQCNYLKYVNGFYVYTSYNSFFALVESISFILIIYNINIENILNDKLVAIIQYVADCTLGIYLIHWVVLIILASSGIQALYLIEMRNLFTNILYYIKFGSLVFFISLFIVMILKFFLKTILRGVNYGKEKRLH